MDCESAYESFRKGNDFAARAEALNALIYSGCTEYSQRLLDDFRDQPEEAQLSIIFAMRILAGSQVKRTLASLISEPWLTNEVRAALTAIVGDLGLVECLPILREQLEHDSAPIRLWTCQTLGMIGGPDELSSLEVLLADCELGYLEETVADSAGWAISLILGKDENLPRYPQSGY